jgi:DNA-binding XRE family transcriptional regulator
MIEFASLPDLRLKTGCTVSHLARTSGISRTTINKIEKGGFVRADIAYKLLTTLRHQFPGDIIREEIQTGMSKLQGIEDDSSFLKNRFDRDELMRCIDYIDKIISKNIGAISNNDVDEAISRMRKTISNLQFVSETRRRHEIVVKQK